MCGKMLDTHENRKTVRDTLNDQSEVARWLEGRLGPPPEPPSFNLSVTHGRSLVGSFYIVQVDEVTLYRALYLWPGEIVQFDDVRLVAEAFCFGPQSEWVTDVWCVHGQGCVMLAEKITTDVT